MRVLVTGGAGYVGTELIRNLNYYPEVEEIVVYDNLSRGTHTFFLCQSLPKLKIRFVNGDLLDSRKLKKQVQEADVIYHLAARIASPYADSDPHFFEQINHWGTAELSYAIEECPNVRKVIHLSSISVYGASSKKELNEESDLNPRTNYGISKMRGESFIERLSDRTNVLILRSGNVFGFSPSMRFDAVINRFAFEAHFTKHISIHGDGQQERSFIHIDKLARGLAQILITDIPSGVYNYVDVNKTIMDIALTLKDIRPELEMIFINQHLKLRNLMVNTNCKLFQYIPREETNFEEDVEQLVNKFVFNPQVCF